MPPPKYLDQANRLIAALSSDFRAVVLERCELVELEREDVLTQAGQHTEHLYFPIDSYVALIFNLEDSYRLQVGLTGNEGMTNASVLLGPRVATLTTVVQAAGRAFQISCGDVQELLDSNEAMKCVLHGYMALSLDQLARNMACAGIHTVEQRLSRWLLVAKDCTHSKELFLTHADLASILGVRRERVAPVASLLQKNGLIHYNRGHVTITDEAGLQALACKCYVASMAAYKNNLGRANPELSVI